MDKVYLGIQVSVFLLTVVILMLLLTIVLLPIFIGMSIEAIVNRIKTGKWESSLPEGF